MRLKRDYYMCELPQVGDVLDLVPNSPFGAAIITKIHTSSPAAVERIHASTNLAHQIQIGVERLDIMNPYEYQVFCNESGEKDNRLR